MAPERESEAYSTSSPVDPRSGISKRTVRRLLPEYLYFQRLQPYIDNMQRPGTYAAIEFLDRDWSCLPDRKRI
jgi:hypothetical protein